MIRIFFIGCFYGYQVVKLHTFYDLGKKFYNVYLFYDIIIKQKIATG